MAEYPDQHLIEELYRELKGEDKNGGTAQAEGRGGVSKVEDAAVLERIFGEKRRGAEFRDIYYGDYAKHRPEWTNSEAVAAMLRKLAFYTSNDPVQMERLIRDSGLDRIKYDSPRVGSTWLREEISKAIADTPEPYAPDLSDPTLKDKSGRSGGEGRSSSKYFEGGILIPDRQPLEVVQLNSVPDPGPRKWLVEDLWPEGTTCLMHGDGGAAKSILALSLQMAIARGAAQWLGYGISKQTKVLYIDFELTADEQRRRMLQLLAGEGVAGGEFPSEHLLYLSAAGRTPKEVYSLAYRWCDEHDVRAICVDSVGMGMMGNPGDNFDIISFFQECVDVFRRDFGASVLAVDHQRRAGLGESQQSLQAYGGVYKSNCIRSRIQVELKDPGKSERGVILRHGKSNFGAEEDPFKVKVSFEEKMIRISRSELSVEERQQEKALNARARCLLALYDEEATRAKLCEDLELADSSVRNRLRELKSEVPPLVKQTSKEGNAPVYGLTEAGRAQVEAMLHVPDRPDLPLEGGSDGSGSSDDDQLEI